MKALYDLKEMLSAELEEIARKPEMSAGDLETVHKLTDTIKNIDRSAPWRRTAAILKPETGREIMAVAPAMQTVESIMSVAITPEMGVVVTAVTGGWADIAGMMPKRP